MEKCATARQATYDNIKRRMRTACWITKATDTHSGYVKRTAFPQWLQHEGTSVSRLHVPCLPCSYFIRSMCHVADHWFHTDKFYSPAVHTTLSEVWWIGHRAFLTEQQDDISKVYLWTRSHANNFLTTAGHRSIITFFTSTKIYITIILLVCCDHAQKTENVRTAW